MQGSYTGAVSVGSVPLSLKSLEAEDASDVRQLYDGDDILATSLKISPLKRLHISRTLAVVRALGHRSIRVKCRQDLEMLNIEQRVESFTEDVQGVQIVWQGPSPAEMARAGWYCLSADRASCPYCGVTVREWQRDDDPWQRHKQFSPGCRYLRQAGEAGNMPSPEGKKMLRHSLSSLYDFNRP